MSKNGKIVIILVIVIALLCPMLVSCNEGIDTQSEVSDETSKETLLVPHLGKADYTGKTLKILASHNLQPFGEAQIAPEEQNTEPVNDAVFKRNELLKQEYGFTIQVEYADGYQALIDTVRTVSDSGDFKYDLYSSGVYYLSTLATEGFTRDIRKLPNSHLQLDEDWWDTKIHDNLSLGNKLYFATGDIFVLDDQYTCVTYFNKDLIKQNNLENPYDLVLTGDWTLDKMYSMIKAVAKDDGDGVMNVDGNDIWGLVGYAYDCYKYIVGCNSPQVYKNSNTDLPYLAMTEQHSIDSFEKVFDIFMDNERVAFTERFYAWNHALAPTVTGTFYNDKALFFASRIDTVSSAAMTESKVKYGIIPQPKLNKEQERYTSVVDSYHFYCLSFPNNPKADFDFATFAVEAMAYTSKIYVTPEYYNRTLQLKRLDDQDSAEMLDIIFSNRIADMSIVFNWDDCIQYYNRMLGSKSKDIVSYVDGRRSAFDLAMEKTIEAFYGLED